MLLPPVDLGELVGDQALGLRDAIGMELDLSQVDAPTRRGGGVEGA